MIAPLDHTAEREPLPVGQMLPIGHVSLLEMINFSLRKFIEDLGALDALIEDTTRASAENEVSVRAYKARMHKLLSRFFDNAKQYGWLRTHDRIGHSMRFINITDKTKWEDITSHLKVLRDALLDDIKEHSLFHYDSEKVKAYKNRNQDWKSTLNRFRSAVDDVSAATDCYALGYNTASVFHLMRIAEFGLRALSYSLRVEFPKENKPIEWAEWQTLIDQIRVKGEEQASALPKGPLRDKARDFYSGAVSHFAGFKDKYRNAVMHVRAEYNEGDALSAMIHVRDFMNGLSQKIGENTKTPIQWS